MVARVNPRDRFDLGAAAQHIEAITGDPNTVMDWRAFPNWSRPNSGSPEHCPTSARRRGLTFAARCRTLPSC